MTAFDLLCLIMKLHASDQNITPSISLYQLQGCRDLVKRKKRKKEKKEKKEKKYLLRSRRTCKRPFDFCEIIGGEKYGDNDSLYDLLTI
jgi:hypothetical protein